MGNKSEHNVISKFMIDNLEIIKPLLEFPHKDIFYFVQILQRGKDNPELKMSNSRVIKTYYITSLEKLETRYEEMQTLANMFNARVCINLNPRNFEKAGFKLLQKVANQMMNKDFYNIHKAYDSICGEYHSEIDKRWITDIDKDDLDKKNEIIGAINLIQNKDTTKGYKILGIIPTKSGIHIISNPFNQQEFKKVYPKIDIHINNPTLLYY